MPLLVAAQDVSLAALLAGPGARRPGDPARDPARDDPRRTRRGPARGRPGARRHARPGTALERVELAPGEDVIVLGPGPIGLLAAMAARSCGASRVVVAGRSSSAERLGVAESLGFETWRTEDPDLVERASRMADGLGADVVIDTTGALIDAAVRMARRRGRVCALGLHGPGSIALSWDVAMFQAVDLSFGMSSSFTSWDRALSLLASGAVDASALARVFRLDDWEKAFSTVADRGAIKAVIVP